MSMSAVSGCGGLWALRWSIRRRIKSEEWTSKLPYTLYGCFCFHPKKLLLLVRTVEYFTAACKICR